MVTVLDRERAADRLFFGRDVAPAELLRVGSGAAAVYSHRSPGEAHSNEDAAAVLPYAGRTGVLAVADGVGGERSGARAARLALESLASAVRQGVRTDLPVRSAVLNGIEEADRAVARVRGGAATTIAIVQIEDRVVRPYHVGDSVILVVGRRGRIKHQTITHGPVGYAVEAGLLDEGEALHHEERHVVSNVVGAPDMRIEIGPRLPLGSHDTVLLASDGVSDNLYPEEIVEAIRKGPLDEAAGRLAEACLARMSRPRPRHPSKADDLTFVIYRPE